MKKLTFCWNSPVSFNGIILGKDVYSWYNDREHYWIVLG